MKICWFNQRKTKMDTPDNVGVCKQHSELLLEIIWKLKITPSESGVKVKMF